MENSFSPVKNLPVSAEFENLPASYVQRVFFVVFELAERSLAIGKGHRSVPARANSSIINPVYNCAPPLEGRQLHDSPAAVPINFPLVSSVGSVGRIDSNGLSVDRG